MLGTATYVTNGNQQSVSEQSSPSAYPATIWRRSGTATPRVVRSLGGKLWFTAQGSSPPGSIFDLAPSASIAIPAGSPACAAGRSNATCDLTASAVTPLLECVVETSDHRLIAHFGYTNADRVPRRLGVGPENRFDRADADACQPTNFANGTHHDVFAVGFVEELTWIVGAKSATAGRSSPRCAAGSVSNTEVSP